MRIALYGYGKMGKAIEAALHARGHEVVLRVTKANAGAAPSGADVAIEFSKPEQALANMRLCMEMGVPVVVGTTGWYDKLPEVRRLVDEYKGSLLWASNFSVGVNLFFRVNRQLAALMDKVPAYAARIDEVHHAHKLDAPSGTAITLANDIDLRAQRYAGWELVGSRGHVDPALPNGQLSEAVSPAPVPISSERTGEVPGKHSVTWSSANDRITITHEAFNRSGFATGAVIAAEWLLNRKGLFTMDDVLDMNQRS
ncbi:MAG: 4-hydroxy-tetrahydrodipicolinate reductase [Flavobacteriales bacterium]|jgi:4-hydroxy-tetrahydrodipicolinate reductase|nr:4-hydroxy-tetrahydrodipicolinate reductase [Flavobacteriales bacterium]